MKTTASETHYIYRLYNDKDQLLYVGISNDVNRRIAEHRASQEWFGMVVREERERFICERADIEAQEKKAIRRERPIYNKIHNVFSFGGRIDSRKKTKGILFRMEPRLYDALAKCANTDDELKTITAIITRGAIMEVDRIMRKYGGCLNALQNKRVNEREMLDKIIGV